MSGLAGMLVSLGGFRSELSAFVSLWLRASSNDLVAAAIYPLPSPLPKERGQRQAHSSSNDLVIAAVYPPSVPTEREVGQECRYFVLLRYPESSSG